MQWLIGTLHTSLVIAMCLPITAAKAALFRFIQSKETSQREKDLLKSVKVWVITIS